MSSRNAYLSAGERKSSVALSRAINDVARKITCGGIEIGVACQAAVAELKSVGFNSVDYVAVRDAETLAPVDVVARPARVLAAAWLGKTRLIDNVAAGPGA